MTALVHYPAVSSGPVPVEPLRESIRRTIERLRQCRAWRDAKEPVHLTTDPTWLVDTAINRRAGWPEDPHARVTVNLPRLTRWASYDAEKALSRLAHAVNTPRLIVRLRDVPSTLRKKYLRRMPNRITLPGEE